MQKQISIAWPIHHFTCLHLKGDIMKKTIKINDLKDIQSVTSVATDMFDNIQLHDELGAIANAKSILGIMALDCSKPLVIESDNPEAVLAVCSAVQKM